MHNGCGSAAWRVRGECLR